MQQRFLQNKDSLVGIIKRIIPQLSSDSHKGNCGRIGVIGGSFEYTGAPYYSGISALRTGADLSYVFCSSDAAMPIKSYSPELIVLPVLDSFQAVKTQAVGVIGRLHAVVLGPGLGRNPTISSNIKFLVEEVKRQNIPLVVDADGLYFVNESPDLVKGYSRAVLTPNVVEFGRLLDKLGHSKSANDVDAVKLAAKTMGCTIVRKGREDIISDGEQVIVCDMPGGFRRCGGQGDLLSGSLGTFTAWSFSAVNGEIDGHRQPLTIAALGACLLTRQCNALAFAKHGRATLTTDMITEIGCAFTSLYE